MQVTSLTVVLINEVPLLRQLSMTLSEKQSVKVYGEALVLNNHVNEHISSTGFGSFCSAEIGALLGLFMTRCNNRVEEEPDPAIMQCTCETHMRRSWQMESW
jgi:hypothetical protein